MKLQKKKFLIGLIFMCILMSGLIWGCARTYMGGEVMTSDDKETTLELETTTVTVESETTTLSLETTTPEPETTTVEFETTTPEPEMTTTSEPEMTTTAEPETTIAEPEITMPSGYYGALHVEGGKLRDSDGNEVVLKGISTAGLQWFPQYVNKETFAFLKGATGMNVVRLAMYTAEGGYCHKDANGKIEMEALINKGVAAATELNMYVIIDWHILSDGNPNTYKEEAKVFFDKMSKQYAEYDNVIYEICNEPNGGTSWEDIKRYANEVIPVIRNNDVDAIVLVGTPTWSQEIDKALSSPLEFDNIMYTLHFYAATHTEYLRSRLRTALDEGIPVFISEFGICDASGNGGINEYEAGQWVSLMESYGLSYCIWNLSNKNETSSIISAGCNKLADWEYNEWSASGQWFLKIMGK